MYQPDLFPKKITVAYLAGYGGVQSFELLYVGLIDFGIGSFLFTGFLVVIGLNRFGICAKYFLSFPQKTCRQRKLRQTKCLLFYF